MVKTIAKLIWIAACPCILLANVDFVLIPFFKKHQLIGLHLYSISSLAATLELYYWDLFWKFIIELVINGAYGGDNLVINFIKKTFHWALNDNNWITRFIKWGGYVGIFVIAIFWERATSVIFCRWFKWRRGFYVLAVANIIHTCLWVYGWSLAIAQFQKLFY